MKVRRIEGFFAKCEIDCITEDRTTKGHTQISDTSYRLACGIGVLEMEYEPVTKSTSNIAQSTPLSQRMEIPESRVPGILNDPLKAGW